MHYNWDNIRCITETWYFSLVGGMWWMGANFFMHWHMVYTYSSMHMGLNSDKQVRSEISHISIAIQLHINDIF
jgi:hypothetical protein